MGSGAKIYSLDVGEIRYHFHFNEEEGFHRRSRAQDEILIKIFAHLNTPYGGSTVTGAVDPKSANDFQQKLNSNIIWRAGNWLNSIVLGLQVFNRGNALVRQRQYAVAGKTQLLSSKRWVVFHKMYNLQQSACHIIDRVEVAKKRPSEQRSQQLGTVLRGLEMSYQPGDNIWPGDPGYAGAWLIAIVGCFARRPQKEILDSLEFVKEHERNDDKKALPELIRSLEELYSTEDDLDQKVNSRGRINNPMFNHICRSIEHRP
ncbi:hypothetical protein TWF481_002827 [Arthrobotrys musiformis]|uniref:DDE Tnp4 domain-containing protein n=1 Tax=Arthrobotrys musiformis TaxID=47236 RepID=A0AAV9VRD2_9PEZI